MRRIRKNKAAEHPPFRHKPFQKLASLLRDPKKESLPDVHLPRVPAPPSDEDLFAEAMRDVREIPEFREMKVKQRQRPDIRIPTQPESDSRSILKEIIQGRRPLQLENMQEFVSWLHPRTFRAYPANLLQHIHEGTYSVQDYIDLHGMTVETAESALDHFLRHALARNFRCVKIIHGRGLRSAAGPVLKERLLALLQTRHAKHVVGYVTARPNDGGLGAVYVLLRRKPFS